MKLQRPATIAGTCHASVDLIDTRSEVNILVHRVIAIRRKAKVVTAVDIGCVFCLQSESCVVSHNTIARGAVETRSLNLRGRTHGVAAHLSARPGERRASQRRQHVGEGLISPLYLEALRRI